MFYNPKPKSHFYKYPRVRGCLKRLADAPSHTRACVHVHQAQLGYVVTLNAACHKLASGLNGGSMTKYSITNSRNTPSNKIPRNKFKVCRFAY